MSAIINSFELLKLNFDILKDWNIEIANIPGYSGWLGLNDIDNIAVIYQWQGTDEPIDYKLHEMLHCALRAFRKTESIDAEERLVRDICYIFRDALYHATTPAKGEDGMNILDALRNEIDRNKELVEIYKTIPTGGFGKMMIERDIKLAEDAIAEQDTVQMIRLYGVLKGNN